MAQDEDTKEQERKREDDRERKLTVAGIAAIIIAFLAVVAALIAASSHRAPTWLVVVGAIGVTIALLPAVVLAWLAVYGRWFSWTVEHPFAAVKTAVQKDQALLIFPTVIAPAQVVAFFVSNEFIEDKPLRISLGAGAAVLSLVGGVFAAVAQKKMAYFIGGGAVFISVIPTAVAASDYHRWMKFWDLGVIDKTAILCSVAGSIFAVVFVIIMLPRVMRAKG